MLRALLMQYLEAGTVSHDAISQVSDPASKAFISDMNYKSIEMNEDEFELAQRLESACFIRSLNPEKKEGHFRFIPHNSLLFRGE